MQTGRSKAAIQFSNNLNQKQMGGGTQTQGVVLVHQFRMIDPSQDGLTLIEQAPDELMEEVRTRVAAMLD